MQDSFVYDGCKTDYELSEIKYVVDAWSVKKVLAELKRARLITFDETIDL